MKEVEELMHDAHLAMSKGAFYLRGCQYTGMNTGERDIPVLGLQSSLVYFKYPETRESCLFQVAKGPHHCLSCHTN